MIKAKNEAQHESNYRWLKKFLVKKPSFITNDDYLSTLLPNKQNKSVKKYADRFICHGSNNE
jgi:hypothetical protein